MTFHFNARHATACALATAMAVAVAGCTGDQVKPSYSRSSARPLSDISQRLHQQAIDGVHRLDASLGREPDASSERMAASLAHLARATGFSQIDHVLLGRPTDATPESQNVFIVQGMLGEASHRRAYMSVPGALREPVEDSLQKLQDLDATLAAEQEAREMGIEVVRRRV